MIDDNLYTAGPGVAVSVVERAFGKPAGQLAELIIEYAPHPPFGTGTAKSAGPQLVAHFEGLMADIVSHYRQEAIAAFHARR